MQSTSASLLNGLRDLDPQSWRNLSKIYGPFVYGYARTRGLQASDASDATQEVFAAVLVGMHQFRKELPSQSFRSWLFGISRNIVAEYYRRLYREPRAMGGSSAQDRFRQRPDSLIELAPELSDECSVGGPAHDSFASRSEIARQAWKIIQSEFNPKHLEVCRLRAEGLQTAEIAQQLGISVHVVYQATTRIRQRLKEYLDGLY